MHFVGVALVAILIAVSILSPAAGARAPSDVKSAVTKQINAACRLDGNYLAGQRRDCPSGTPREACRPGMRDIPVALQAENFCVTAAVEVPRVPGR